MLAQLFLKIDNELFCVDGQPIDLALSGHRGVNTRRRQIHGCNQSTDFCSDKNTKKYVKHKHETVPLKRVSI